MKRAELVADNGDKIVADVWSLEEFDEEEEFVATCIYLQDVSYEGRQAALYIDEETDDYVLVIMD